jgi:hypothetical protein
MDVEEVQKTIKQVLPRIDQLMALEVTNAEQFTEEQLEELHSILIEELGDIDIKKARMLHVITGEEYKKISDFFEWDKALGGYKNHLRKFRS